MTLYYVRCYYNVKLTGGFGRTRPPHFHSPDGDAEIDADGMSWQAWDLPFPSTSISNGLSVDLLESPANFLSPNSIPVGSEESSQHPSAHLTASIVHPTF